MATEIERRFFPVAGWHPQQQAPGMGAADPIVQGYFWPGETVDARVHCSTGPVKRFSLLLNILHHQEPMEIPLPEADGIALHDKTGGRLLSKAWTLRVRNSGSKGGEFCLKGKAKGLERPEYEYPLSAARTGQLLALCSDTHIHKDRYTHGFSGRQWEIDVFRQQLPGEPAIIIELELPHPEAAFARPDYVGEEITGSKGLSNAKMARRKWEFARALSL